MDSKIAWLLLSSGHCVNAPCSMMGVYSLLESLNLSQLLFSYYEEIIFNSWHILHMFMVVLSTPPLARVLLHPGQYLPESPWLCGLDHSPPSCPPPPAILWPRPLHPQASTMLHEVQGREGTTEKEGMVVLHQDIFSTDIGVHMYVPSHLYSTLIM